jgi:FAD/FMN-containing dehydrogenase
VELLDPFGWEQAACRGTASLAVRLLGSRDEVDAMVNRVRRELGGEGEIRRLGSEESRAFHRRLGTWEDGADLVLRLVALPSLLGEVVGLAEELAAVLRQASHGTAPAVRMAAHVGVGVLRLALAGASNDEGGVKSWIEAVRGLRGRMEGIEGSLTVSSGPSFLLREVGVWGGGGGEAALLRALKGQFDPRGILVPGRIVG